MVKEKFGKTAKMFKNILKLIVEYTAKIGTVYNFSKSYLPIVFLIHIHKGNVLLEVADEEHTYLLYELKSISKPFLKKARILLTVREKILNNFKSKIFPIKNSDKNLTSEQPPEPTGIF